MVGTKSRAGPRGDIPIHAPRAPLPPLVAVAMSARLTRVLSQGKVTAPDPEKEDRGQLRTGTHFDLVAVGPIGPIIKIIVGSDFFCKQLGGDEKNDCQGHEDFHVGFLGRVERRDQGEKNTYIGGGYPRIGQQNCQSHNGTKGRLN